MSEPIGEAITSVRIVPHAEGGLGIAGAMHQGMFGTITETVFRKGKNAINPPRGYVIQAELSEPVSIVYKSLDTVRRHQLEYATKSSIAQTAYQLLGESDYQSYFDRSQALMNYQPLLFEPEEGNMLVGAWRLDAEQNEKNLYFTSEVIKNEERCRILLGGLATFATFVSGIKPLAN